MSPIAAPPPRPSPSPPAAWPPESPKAARGSAADGGGGRDPREAWEGGGAAEKIAPDVTLLPAYFTHPEADAHFAALRDTVAWRQETATLFGRPVALPRLTAWYGDPGARYAYSGIVNEPLPWSAALNAIKVRAEDAAGVRFNSVLLNFYRDGRDSVSWHSDDEPALGREPVIASVSFGVARMFQFRTRPPLPRARRQILLPHGSLLLMQGRSQRDWQHQIPKTARPLGPRINLTFRQIRG